MRRKKLRKPGCCPECGQMLHYQPLTFEQVVGPERAAAYREEMRRQQESARKERARHYPRVPWF